MSATISKYVHAVGKTAMLRTERDDEIEFEVKVLDIKRAFGRVELLVTPVAGNGERWVKAEGRIRLVDA